MGDFDPYGPDAFGPKSFTAQNAAKMQQLSDSGMVSGTIHGSPNNPSHSNSTSWSSPTAGNSRRTYGGTGSYKSFVKAGYGMLPGVLKWLTWGVVFALCTWQTIWLYNAFQAEGMDAGTSVGVSIVIALLSIPIGVFLIDVAIMLLIGCLYLAIFSVICYGIFHIAQHLGWF